MYLVETGDLIDQPYTRRLFFFRESAYQYAVSLFPAEVVRITLEDDDPPTLIMGWASHIAPRDGKFVYVHKLSLWGRS